MRLLKWSLVLVLLVAGVAGCGKKEKAPVKVGTPIGGTPGLDERLEPPKEPGDPIPTELMSTEETKEPGEAKEKAPPKDPLP